MIGLMTVLALIIAAPHWVPIRTGDWTLLVAIGVFSAIAQHLLTEAFRNAPPSVVAPFEYTALLWGILIDRVVWGVFPTSRVYIGGGIVIAIQRSLERRKHAQRAKRPSYAAGKNRAFCRGRRSPRASQMSAESAAGCAPRATFSQ
jgi:drug/metabolite transporter (DMT)-like permease